MFLNFSVVPLRISSALGSILRRIGFVATSPVLMETLLTNTPPGWGSLMYALFIVCGVQLLTVGLVGEYIGRLYLTANRRPQSVVREVLRSDDERVRADPMTETQRRAGR